MRIKPVRGLLFKIEDGGVSIRHPRGRVNSLICWSNSLLVIVPLGFKLLLLGFNRYFSPVGAVEVEQAFAQPLHLSVALQGDARLGVTLLHVEHHVVVFVVFRYSHNRLSVNSIYKFVEVGVVGFCGVLGLGGGLGCGQAEHLGVVLAQRLLLVE